MAVIEELQKDIKSLEDKRGLDQDEIQRFKVSAAELQQRVWSFQQENGMLKNQLGQQQVEMQKHIESLQNELMAARQQQQVRGVVVRGVVVKDIVSDLRGVVVKDIVSDLRGVYSREGHCK